MSSTHTNTEETPSKAAFAAALMSVLGVVYGDIGTSPLYALQAAFGTVAGHDQALTADIISGLASMILWTLTLVVTVKYVMLVMRASHNGEGGIVALMSLAQKTARSASNIKFLGIIGIGGCCLFFGDSMITPAISILSAMEGIRVVAPQTAGVIIPITILILGTLFSLQSLGTGLIGRAFGPIMVAWFSTLAILGIYGIAQHPQIIESLLPTHAISFATAHPILAFLCLGSVVLSVTGAEALYADIGHFSAPLIRYGWMVVVFPALILNYLGQAAVVTVDANAAGNPFYHLAPSWAQYPLLVLATLATITASQAGISGTFSLCRQLIQLGYLPRLRVLHTDPNEESQIYVPFANKSLAASSMILVLAFQSSEALSAAYGIAVTGTFLCTTVLCMVVFRNVFRWMTPVVILVFGSLFTLDALFFSANTLKVADGGWVPLLIATTASIIMFTWERGRAILDERRRADSIPLKSFLARLQQSKTFAHVPGYAIYLNSDPEIVPNAFLYNLRYNKVLHDRLLLLTIDTLNIPQVSAKERLTVQILGPGIYRVIIKYGFMEDHDLPRTLKLLDAKNIDFDVPKATYFLSYEHALRSKVPRLSAWRQALFSYMLQHSISVEEFYQIPPERTVEFGVRIMM